MQSDHRSGQSQSYSAAGFRSALSQIGNVLTFLLFLSLLVLSPLHLKLNKKFVDSCVCVGLLIYLKRVACCVSGSSCLSLLSSWDHKCRTQHPALSDRISPVAQPGLQLAAFLPSPLSFFDYRHTPLYVLCWLNQESRSRLPLWPQPVALGI